jgi:hypothetical protein
MFNNTQLMYLGFHLSHIYQYEWEDGQMKILIMITVISLGILCGCNKSFSEPEAINLALKNLQESKEPFGNEDFPKRSGTKRLNVKIGGMYGSRANLELTTKVDKVIDETYEVTFIKDWNTIVNDINIVSYWRYRVDENNVVLINEDDKDGYMAEIG